MKTVQSDLRTLACPVHQYSIRGYFYPHFPIDFERGSYACTKGQYCSKCTIVQSDLRTLVSAVYQYTQQYT